MKKFIIAVICIFLLSSTVYPATFDHPVRMQVGNYVSPEFNEFKVDSFNVRDKLRLINVVVKLLKDGNQVGYQTVNIYGNDYDNLLTTGITIKTLEDYIIQKYVK
jgi:hypothetical protein